MRQVGKELRPLRGACLMILAVFLLNGKDKARIQIEVVDTHVSEGQRSVFIPGTQSTSQTNCNATVYGSPGVASGQSNCATTTTPGRPSTVAVVPTQWAEVFVKLPDGRGARVHCQPVFKSCPSLNPGQYPAEVKGNALIIYGRDLDGKEHGAKFNVVGYWTPAESKAGHPQ
jgi:hypothetical protein